MSELPKIDMPLLQVQNLQTSFYTRNGVVRAVNDVSFQIEKGETLGIVGESGSGKSVTCYSILGLIPQPPGRIEGGKAMFQSELDLLKCSSKELNQVRGRRIAMIFQDPMTSLNPYLRIEDQLIEPLLIHEKISREEAVERIGYSGCRDSNQKLSAPVFRRDATAGDDRDGPDHQAGFADCG